MNPIYLVDKDLVDQVIEDIGARISINQMRLEDNDSKLTATIRDNINNAMGMFQTLKLLELVDLSTEKDIKKGLEIFY